MDGGIIPAWLARDQGKNLGFMRVQAEEVYSKTGLTAGQEHVISDFHQN